MSFIRRAAPVGLAFTLAAALLSGIGGSATAAPADQSVYGLTPANELVSFTAASPGTVSAPVAITGLDALEDIVAIDVRPANGQIYALTDDSQLYTVDATTGVAVQVGAAPFSPALIGTAFGFDFNPVVDRIRVVSDTGQNLRLHPDTGEVVDGDTATIGIQGDADLDYDDSDANDDDIPALSAAAYTNNTAGAASTTLFGIDQRVLLIDPERLVTVGSADGTVSPNSGKLFTVGNTNTAAVSTDGLDIAADGTAYAVARPLAAASSLYTVNTSTGAFTLLGAVEVLLGLDDIAVASPDTVVRLAGENRVETAIEAAQSTYPVADSATSVVLARSDAFPDALAGVPLAVAKDGPLLLTPSNALDPATKTEIDRLLTAGDTVYLLGGETALNAAVETSLEAAGYVVVRYGGADRYETAVRIAADGLGNPGTFLLATGRNFPDALSGGAAAVKADAAILLTDDTVLPAATNAYLLANPASARFALGGQAAAAAPSVTALAGADRFETSRLVAEEFFPDAELSAAGFASGRAFPDGLSGGAHIGSAVDPGPMLLTEVATLPETIAEYLEERNAEIGSGFLYGGTTAVQDSVLTAIQAAIT
ncbi:MAG: DUF4394 domain-containing protein [Acidimicrobiia bacterium]